VSPVTREHFLAPPDDRGVVLRPPVAGLVSLVARNREAVGSYALAVAGRQFGAFRAAARAEVVALARGGTERWGFAAGRSWAEPAPLIFTGHQPRPFHPGVWFKNFVAGRLAAATGGVAVNLDVDNDEARDQVFTCPARGPAGEGSDEVHTAAVAYAAPAGGLAYEEQPARALRPEAGPEMLALAPSPAVADAFRQFWRRLTAAAPRAASLGEAFVIARRAQESDLGLTNLELPVSRLADGVAFRLFVTELLRRREGVLAAYNEALAEYRRAYHERSAAQPLPDLARDGPRHELPLWAWRAGERRRRLWFEDAPAGGLRLVADGAEVVAFSAAELTRSDAVAARLAAARDRGWKLRPRALAMTLFVRLALADLFIHGLGGALYDKITDVFAERLFNVRLPALAVATATVLLPHAPAPLAPRDLASAQYAIRDWRYNPDRCLGPAALARPEVRALVEEKRLLVAVRGSTREDRRRDFLRVRDLNARLAAFDADGPERAWRRWATLERRRRAAAVLRGREYPYALYAPEDLAAFYREAAALPS